jgi:two-component system sensor histidine kinase/response regulator
MNKESVILIVDDDVSILRMFSLALQNAGYRTLTASDAEQGFALARTHLPDVILSDINMPGTDGRSFLRNLRADPDLAATQFVLMTGNTRDMNARSGIEEGADDFLCKPFDVGELCRCIEARLARTRVHWRVEDRMINELKSSLLRNLPHEFFTPLAGVIGMAEMLHTDWRDLPPEEVSEMILQIKHSGWRLHRTLRNYLNIIDPAFPDINAHPGMQVIALAELSAEIQSIASDVVLKHQREADLSFKLDPPSMPINLSLLRLLVEELVSNACGFSASASPIEVTIAANRVLTVCDQGRGMTEDQVHRIHAFRQFERKRYEQQGLGLGLAMVHRIVNAFQAELFIQSSPGKGTVVSIEFP